MALIKLQLNSMKKIKKVHTFGTIFCTSGHSKTSLDMVK